MKITSALLVALFVLTLVVPAFAQDMSHSPVYEMDGEIDFFKQAGHLCNTGAAHYQTIEGSGEMSKVQNVTMVKGKIAMDDANDFIAGDTDLTVTSVILLCAPAKSELGEIDLIGYLEAYWRSVPWRALIYGSVAPIQRPGIGEDPLTWEYLEQYHTATYAIWKPIQDLLNEGAVIHPTALYTMLKNSEAPFDTAHLDEYGSGPELSDLGINWSDLVNPLTSQIWAVQVSADPGFSGNLHQDFEAAYGFWAGADDYLGNGDNAWSFDNGDVVRGPDYVGNYFNIDQFARTSMGTVQRFIDISSPWSGAYLYEDMSIVGTSEIEEAFSMENIAPGADIIGDWWDIF